jgi:plastocyanin
MGASMPERDRVIRLSSPSHRGGSAVTPVQQVARIHACRSVVAAMLAATVLGCNDSPVAAGPGLDTVYWALSADVKAVTVAMGGTQHVVATPRTIAGDALPGLPAPHFVSKDTTKVTVDENGVITGVIPSQNVLVIASLQAQGMTHADTISVNVTPTADTVASFSVDVPPGDSTVMGSGMVKFLMVNALNPSHIPLFNLAVWVHPLDPGKFNLVAGPFMPLVMGTGVGTGRVEFRATAYGVTFADTVEFTITYPWANTVKLPEGKTAFDAPVVYVVKLGTITWLNQSAAPIDITFDDTTNVVGGNIPAIPPGGSATRQFLEAGTYPYHSAAIGATGKVIVQ